MSLQYDVVIVGAGVAGCAAAVTFGKQGRTVLMLERNLAEPDRIVGELLQPGGCHALEELGLEDCVEGIDAIRVDGYGVFRKSEKVHIPYPSDPRRRSTKQGADAEKCVFAQGRSFHHGRFVAKLRQKAMSTNNVEVKEATVTNLIYANDEKPKVIGVAFKAESGKEKKQNFEIRSAVTIIADGCFSKFRSEFTDRKPYITSHFVGFILQSCPLPFSNHGHVVLGDPSPTLLYQIGTNETRVLVDVPITNRNSKSGWTWETGHGPRIGDASMKEWLGKVVVKALPEEVKPSFLEALDTQQLRIMPNSYLPPITCAPDGVILIGDAMNMRHPLTGGGMTVALTDVVLLRTLLDPSTVPSLSDSIVMMKQIKLFQKRRRNLSSVINILAGALYALFSADDENLNILREACIAYFKQGGDCVDGPVGLLSGIIPSPAVLVYHFFAVAFLGMRRVFNGEDDSDDGSKLSLSDDPPPYDVSMISEKSEMREKKTMHPVSLLQLPARFIRCFLVLRTAVVVIGPLALAEFTPDLRLPHLASRLSTRVLQAAALALFFFLAILAIK